MEKLIYKPNRLLFLALLLPLPFSSCKIDPLTVEPKINITGTTTADVIAGDKHLFSLEISNTGGKPLIITDIEIENNSSNAYSFDGGKPTMPITIQPNSKFDLDLTFTPQTAKIYKSELKVTSNSVGGKNSLTLEYKGISKSTIVVSSGVGAFTGCDFPASTRTLYEFDSWLFSHYTTNVYKLKVVSIDSASGNIVFNIKRCDDKNFQEDLTIDIYETNPVFGKVTDFFSANDIDATIIYKTKFAGHDSKKYIAVITESKLGGEYYCTKDITISW